MGEVPVTSAGTPPQGKVQKLRKMQQHEFIKEIAG